MVRVIIGISRHVAIQRKPLVDHFQLQGAAAIVGDEDIVQSGWGIESCPPLVCEEVACHLFGVSKAVLHLKHLCNDLVRMLTVDHVKVPTEDYGVFSADLSHKLCGLVQLAHSMHVVDVSLQSGHAKEGGAYCSACSRKYRSHKVMYKN